MIGLGQSRLYTTKKATILSGAAKPAIGLDVRGFATALIRVPAAWTAADIGFEVAATDPDASGEGVEQNRQDTGYVALVDKTGSRVKITTIATAASKWYEVPAQALMAGFLRIASLHTGTGADENQGADRALVVALKT